MAVNSRAGPVCNSIRSPIQVPLFPRHVSREQDRKQNSQDWNQHPHGMPAFAAGGFIAPAWPDAQVYLLIPFSHECTQSSHVLLPAPNAGRARRWDQSHRGPSHVRNPSCLPGSVSRKRGARQAGDWNPGVRQRMWASPAAPLPKTAPAAPAPSQGPCVHQRADQ